MLNHVNQMIRARGDLLVRTEFLVKTSDRATN